MEQLKLYNIKNYYFLLDSYICEGFTTDICNYKKVCYNLKNKHVYIYIYNIYNSL